MTRRSRRLSLLLAVCLLLQGGLSVALPFQSGMGMAALSDAAEPAAAAKPPCHMAGAAHQPESAPPADEGDDQHCCDRPDFACASLCVWACAFSSAPPAADGSISMWSLPQPPRLALTSHPPPWVPPVPIPPPILTLRVPA